MVKNEDNRGTNAILGNRKHSKSKFDFEDQGIKAIISGNKGTSTPTPEKALLLQ